MVTQNRTRAARVAPSSFFEADSGRLLAEVSFLLGEPTQICDEAFRGVLHPRNVHESQFCVHGLQRADPAKTALSARSDYEVCQRDAAGQKVPHRILPYFGESAEVELVHERAQLIFGGTRIIDRDVDGQI